VLCSVAILAADTHLKLENEMDNVAGKWALVTGASSGFGIQFATLLAERKANLVLAARRTEPMEQLAMRLRHEHDVKAVVEGIDLSLPRAAADLKARLDGHGIVVDILVNNAGFGLYGPFVEQPLQKTVEMLQLNMIALTELTHIFASDMVKRQTGHILLVASLLGYQATPGYAAYAATKAYVLLLGEALHAELKTTRVGVTVVSPGATSTSFAEVAGQRDNSFLRMLMMKPQRVANTGIQAMLRHRMSVVVGLPNKLIVLFFRFTPRSVQGMIMQRVLSA
jgi:uncharacterized protein